MNFFHDMYKKFNTDSEYNADLEGEDTFNIAGYDPTDSGGTGYFADIRATGTGAGTVGHVYRDSDGDFFLRVRATG